MRIRPAVLLVLIVAAYIPVEGETVDLSVHSSALGEERSVRVYLPVGYDTDAESRYLTIYFLHGAALSHESYWSEFAVAETLDSLIGAGTIDPLILIAPDGVASGYEDATYWTDSALIGQFEQYVVNDLVEFIDDSFRTDSSATGRSIMGHSAGGYGAMKLALKHPNRFCAFASHSGMLMLNVTMEQLRRTVLMEHNDVDRGPPYRYRPTGISSKIAFALCAAFSPDLENPRTFVDFFLDEQANMREDVRERWRQHDPPYLAAQLGHEPAPAIDLDCGTADHIQHPTNVTFSEELLRLGIPHEFQSFRGGHRDKLADRLEIGLAFLSKAMHIDPASNESVGEPIAGSGKGP